MNTAQKKKRKFFINGTGIGTVVQETIFNDKTEVFHLKQIYARD